MTELATYVCDVSNALIMDELKIIRQEMKDLHWRLLLKFTEQIEELQTEIKLLRNQQSGISEVHGQTKDVLNCIDTTGAWPMDSQKQKLHFSGDGERNRLELTATPLVLEVTTSQINESSNNGNLNSDMALSNECDGNLSPYNYVSKHLFNESTHIANCKDRHCMLCKSLQVVTAKQVADDQKSQWKCSVCLRYFRRKYNLKNHMRCHTGEKPFQCKVCKHFFRSKQALNYHARKHDSNYKSKLVSDLDEINKSDKEVISL